MKTFLKGVAAGYAVGAVPVAVSLVKEYLDPKVRWRKEDLVFIPMGLVLWPWVLYLLTEESDDAKR